MEHRILHAEVLQSRSSTDFIRLFESCAMTVLQEMLVNALSFNVREDDNGLGRLLCHFFKAVSRCEVILYYL